MGTCCPQQIGCSLGLELRLLRRPPDCASLPQTAQQPAHLPAAPSLAPQSLHALSPAHLDPQPSLISPRSTITNLIFQPESLTSLHDCHALSFGSARQPQLSVQQTLDDVCSQLLRNVQSWLPCKVKSKPMQGDIKEKQYMKRVKDVKNQQKKPCSRASSQTIDESSVHDSKCLQSLHMTGYMQAAPHCRYTQLILQASKQRSRSAVCFRIHHKT